MKNYTKIIIIHSVSHVNFTIHFQIMTNKKNISVFIAEFTLSKKKKKMTNAIQEKGKKNYQNSFSQQFLSFITSNQTISEDSIQIYLIHDFQIHYIHGLILTKNLNLYPNFTIIFRVPQFISFHITHL